AIMRVFDVGHFSNTVIIYGIKNGFAGGGWMEVDGEEFAIDPETLVRVGPSAKRAVMVGPEGLRLLILSGVPGKAYEPPEWTGLGAPDPMAG
ncbi:MAG: hypothetical protein ACKOTH_00305, partial [Solirubrobacterales bacterium]